MKHQTLDGDFEARVRDNFAKQAFMTTLGASITEVNPGAVTIELPFRADLTQQGGFLHAGVVASVADSACGYAAMTLTTPGTDILSVEFKINLLKPAVGTRFRAVGEVVRAGRTLTVCTGEVFAARDGGETSIAVMQATMMALADRG